MIERVPDLFRLIKENFSSQSRAIELDEFLSIQPLNFQFYYAKNGKAEIVNTIYLEDGNPKLDLCLELFNESRESVTFQKGESQAAGLLQCHFYIRFEKDLQLKPKDIAVEPKEQWQVNYDEDDYFFTLYFLHKNGLVLKKQDSPNKSDRILLTLKNLSANNRGVKSTNVELIYGSPLVLNGEIPQATPFTEVLSCKNAISVTHHPDKKNIPLQFRFIGPNTILNDGTTVNNLKLKIFNRPLTNNSRPNLLLDKPNSRFIVSFEANNSEEALTTLPRANNTKITATEPNKWKVEKTQNAPEWKIEINSSSNIDKLTAGEGIELNISDLVTSNGSGVAYLYITYQNIGDYPDGQLVVPIEKTPLLYRGTQVGIGTIAPSAKLQVSGTIQATGDNQTLVGLRVNPTFDNNQKTNIKHLGLQVNGALATTNIETKEVVRLVRGVTSNVKNANSASLNVGAFESGVNGKSQLDIVLAGNPDSSNNWGSEPNVTVMSLLADGRVGIGTNNPKTQLHIVGDVTLGKNDNNTKFVFHSRQTQNGDFLQISPDKSDGDWAWSEGIILKRNGDVGIGQQPSVKLHVNGRIKDKTGWVMPVGSILPYAGSTAPEGWFLCDGSAKDKTPFADLFNVIGTRYGGSGNYFNLPNLNGKIPVGLSGDAEFNSLGKTGGSKTHTLTIEQMPSHSHGVNDPGHSHPIRLKDSSGGDGIDDAGGRFYGTISSETAYTGISILNTGSGQAHNNLQPYITVNYIIKY